MVKELKLKVGDKVSEGTLIMLLEAAGAATPAAAAEAAPGAAVARTSAACQSTAPQAAAICPERNARSGARGAIRR